MTSADPPFTVRAASSRPTGRSAGADPDTVHLALPKGRMEQGVRALLAAAGIGVATDDRAYRPRLSVDGFETKLLKPQNIVVMLAEGSRDLGFAGADWVAERDVELVELLDTELDPVRIVAAAPVALVDRGSLRPPPGRPLVVASEYERLTRAWIGTRVPDAHFVRSHGATEVFPPEDADAIVDNSASGATLRANGLVVLEELMRSSTRLYANPRALEEPGKRRAIDNLVLCLRAVLEARRRAMVELNVSAADLPRVVDRLPCMREPTIAPLHGGAGYAVRAAVPRDGLPRLVPELKAHGATDIVVSSCEQIVP
ncbi:MAG: ATP phosphoribosyltransferase [Planctomycetes bacterium]|nr:ATP phosphoribosyltransferase [Planctomycetota bacterium]